MQMSFKLPKIDRETTKSRVEEALQKYRMFLLMVPEDYEPKITSTFRLAPSTPSNQFHSTTEESAVKKIDQEKQKKDYLNKVQIAVNRLSYQERTIIVSRYFNYDEVYDYEIYNELGYSERKYYRVKARAFYKLAFILRIEVYIENEAI